MARIALIFFTVFLPVWAPWMDSKGPEELTQQIVDAFGPIPAVCYDAQGTKLQDGVSIRWYPLGRLVHTCSHDYVVWIWGAVKEQGGLSKKTNELQAVQSKALTCKEVLERQEARLASSTDSKLEKYTGAYATEPDFSIFKEAEEYKKILVEALKRGPTFAGRFSVAEWGCGPSCQQHAIIDVETGLVVAYGPKTEYGVEYTLESSLLVTNPVTKLPALPDSAYESESLALSVARVPREYYRLTTDALSGTQYLVLQCVESGATGYIEVEDERIGVKDEDATE